MHCHFLILYLINFVEICWIHCHVVYGSKLDMWHDMSFFLFWNPLDIFGFFFFVLLFYSSSFSIIEILSKCKKWMR